MKAETTALAVSPQDALIERISKEWGRSEDEVKAAMSLSFPTLKTAGQLTLAFAITKKYDLDPFVKEIFAYVDSRGNLTLITGKDGFLKIARRQPGYRQIVSAAVYSGDDFEADFAAGAIEKHKVTSEGLKARSGNPIGAYAILRMEGLPDVIKWVDWAEYCPAKTDYTPWAKQKAAMITKCATSVLIREAFGLSGLYDDAEVYADSFGTNFNSTPEESTTVASKLKRKEKAIEYVPTKITPEMILKSENLDAILEAKEPGENIPVDGDPTEVFAELQKEVEPSQPETDAEKEGYEEMMETIDREEAEEEAEKEEAEITKEVEEIQTMQEPTKETPVDRTALNAELDIARVKFSKALADARTNPCEETEKAKLEASSEVVRINRLILSYDR